jgi:DNA ligase D-like protein (predicted 3'-phosphoesterase)
VEASEPANRFVVQQHDATALHYDFRLEVDGVLKSWAVPKGPSTDPGERRLAVQVEDHSLEHLEFEGRAGTGGRGSGAVIVWDLGHYRNLDPERSIADAIEAGHVKIWLHGRKLEGGWTLHRTSGGAKPQWLMIKRRDEKAADGDDVEAERPESVKSGRTIDEVARPAD